tara:strand:+ start:773 stop:940 length:168 start_codon:yes stop_codon:yes gene_type:complete
MGVEDSSAIGSAVSEEPQLMKTVLLRISIIPVNRMGKRKGIEKGLRDEFMRSFKF